MFWRMKTANGRADGGQNVSYLNIDKKTARGAQNKKTYFRQ
jgi:hypothetical protein